MLYLLDTVGGALSAAGRRHAAAAVARLGAMAPGNKAAEAAIRAACGCLQVRSGTRPGSVMDLKPVSRPSLLSGSRPKAVSDTEQPVSRAHSPLFLY